MRSGGEQSSPLSIEARKQIVYRDSGGRLIPHYLDECLKMSGVPSHFLQVREYILKTACQQIYVFGSIFISNRPSSG